MAVTICVLLLTVLTATVSNAGFRSAGWNNNGGSFGFNSAQAYTSSGPLRMPNFPPLPWPSNFPFPQFPNFPQFPTIKPITVQDIAAQGTQPGSNYNGIAVVSQHSTTKTKDGQLGTTGGSTVVLNDNGKVTVQQTGDAPPDISFSQFKYPPFADFQQPEFKQFNYDDIKKPDFDFPSFDSFTFKPIDTEELKTYVPGSNEKFKGNFYSYNSYSSDVNGVKKSGGSAKTINNDNGKVDEQNISFQKGPE